MNRIALVVVATHDLMVVPRILQIMSRRSWRLIQLQSDPYEGDVRYVCEFEGHKKWNDLLPALIAKLPDVKEVSRNE